MSLAQRYHKVILTVAAIVVIPSAIYGGVVLRDRISAPTDYAQSLAAVHTVPASVSNDRRKLIQDELQQLLAEREEVQHKIDEVKARMAK
ncbi:unnamed protein product [Rhizoctonia solani]|uniref:Uncharacterized protein n=1 Tax=Rhizoctonia solani TaxID=456999 RepID=A0A8H2WUY2_9AGAM|nr:uncharacterized protein RhiXN_01082 [Rhizoctonia solani]QRW19676.1 hypothetical protein RhiXN_01082 [Rhizoctonia solani]CAE6404540.1 unnamed protein product [Rhizoctonia solani]